MVCAVPAQAQTDIRPWVGNGVRIRRPNPRAGAAGQPTCRGASLTYFQGPVVSSAQVVTVNWNSNVNPQAVANLPQFYQDMTNSSYFDALGEYSTAGLAQGTNQEIGRGGSLGAYTIVPSECPATIATKCAVTDAQVQAELQAQIGGVLPRPGVDSAGFTTTVYAINFPANVIVSGPGGSGESCRDFCAYHNTGGTATNPLIYSAIMDTFTGGCSNGCGTAASALDNLTSNAGHELVEMVTDPEIGLDKQTVYAYPAGWSDNGQQCGEVADICDNGTLNDLTVGGRTWNVQGFWSNREKACVVTELARTTSPITWPTPSAITYPTPLSGAQLNAGATVAGTFVYAPGSGVVLPAGSQTLTAVFTPNDPSNYVLSSSSVQLHVNQATPTITWAVPSAIAYPAPLSSTQLNATANTPGKFAYTPPIGTVLQPGLQTLSVQFTPNDITDYQPASASVKLQVTGTPAVPCDLQQNGNIGIADVQTIINQALGAASAANDLNGGGTVNVVDVQIEINAALNLGCITGIQP